MIDRNDILEKAMHDCLVEMYAKAQPSADYDKLCQDVKDGKIIDNDKDPIYKRYYLSHEEFIYILEKYKKIYNIKSPWYDHLDLIYDYFTGKGRKDIWIPEEIDENGNKHPGYRSSEAVAHIKDTIRFRLNSYLNDRDELSRLSDELTNDVLSYINNCKTYYKFDWEDSSFSASVALGCSPSSNKEQVIEYWKDNGIDIEIIDRNPLTFWDVDYYGSDYEEVMIDEYGADWENIMWDMYYDSPEGKRKMVSNWINNHSEFYSYYISQEDDQLFVKKFNDNLKIQIDKFIDEYNITHN